MATLQSSDRAPNPGSFAPNEGAQKLPGTCEALGEIDRASAPAFNAELRDTIDGSDEVIVSVDCAGVTFMDSAGYLVLVDASRYAVGRGHELVVRHMSSSCALLIQLCDVDGELRIEV